MAITFIQQPGEVSFAANPIIFKAQTSLTGKTLLRIVLTCTVSYTPVETSESGSLEEDYTYFLGEDNTGTFNVSPTMWTLIRRRIEKNAASGKYMNLNYATTHVSFSVTAKEVYVDGINEIEGESVTAAGFTAITGGLTDWEWLSATTTDVAAYLKGGRILSRKPDGEVLMPDMNFLVPLVGDEGGMNLELFRNGTRTESLRVSDDPWIPLSRQLNTDGCEVGDELTVSFGASSCRKLIVPSHPSMRVFYFLNGFGLPEAVIAYTLDALKYNVESESYTIPAEIGAHGNAAVVNYSEQATSEFSMSSGFVSRQWAEWWIHEFLQTRMAWIIENGTVVPVAIEPDKTIKLYDKSKPDMMSVSFTVMYSFRGGTYNRFL